MPSPAYVASGDSPLVANTTVVAAVGGCPIDRRECVLDTVVPVRSGFAFEAEAGDVIRFTTVDGPQVVDLNMWSRDDPRERFWASRTRQFYGTHLTVGHRLWSNLPFLRPMATFVADTIAYGRDSDDAGCHDLMGTRCDPYVNQMLSGAPYDFHCHSNLTRAVTERGLTEFDVHDVINLFQVTGLMDEDKRYFMKTCPAQPGDHVELLADIDLLLAISLCPGGDLAVPLWGEGSDAEPNCNPLRVQVFRMPADVLVGWSAAQRASYSGVHGTRHGLAQPSGVPPSLADRGH
ncbi:MAG TPA: urea carboxylase-associated family protein [Ilumatobacteraceae bacterium]